MSGSRALAIAILGLGLARPANAAEDADLVLDEILVTAQKREQSLADTPMTVNVVTGRQIADFAIFGLEDINAMAAGLAISGTNFDTDIATRGIGTDLNAAVVSRVTVYLDGAYVSQERGLFSGLFDLQQLELLKGPQGTLYGQASPAGALTIRSRDPDLEHIEGSIRQSFSDHDGSNTQFGASLPLIDKRLGVRVSGLYDTNRHADVRNITLDKDNENETKAYRIVALWRPSEDFRLRLAYHDIKDDFDADQVVKGNGIDFDEREAVGDSPSSFENETDLTILDGSYTFANDWTATLVASYQDNLVTRHWDMDGSPVEGAVQEVISDVPGLENYELRLASGADGRWQWTTGVFYQDSESETPVFVETHVAARPGLEVLVKTTGPALIDGNTTGVFTHNTIQLSEAGTLTAGLRYNRQEASNVQDFVSDYYLIIGGNPIRVGGASISGVAPENQERDDDGVSGSLKYQYRFSEALMGYASFDRGWRAGAPNIAGRPQPTVFGAFDPEDSDNLELGIKWEFLQGRGLLNVAAYYQVYTDFQYQSASVAYRLPEGDSALANPVVNVDEAESWGVDSDLTVRLAENWTLGAALSYNQAELSDATDVPCSTAAPPSGAAYDFNTCDLSGERAGEQPEWSGGLSTEYSRAIGNSASEWYFRGLFKTESEYYSASEGRDLDGYATFDLFLGARSSDRGWDASVWVKNATDETAELKTLRLDPVPDYPTGTSVDSGFTWVKRQLNPRIAGVTVSYNF